MEEDKEYLDARDIDFINIIVDQTECENTVYDVTVEFPERYKTQSVKFSDIGLINILPEIKAINENSSIPKVQFEMYGKLKRRYVDCFDKDCESYKYCSKRFGEFEKPYKVPKSNQ